MIRRLISIVALGGIVVGVGSSLWLYRVHRFNDVFEQVGHEYGVDPDLLAAIVWQESRFQPNAVGRVGEYGLMQVTETVGHEWAAANQQEDFMPDRLFDPLTNVRVGAWYLSVALAQWSVRDDPLPYALAQYNAGRSNALRWARDDEGCAEQFINQITFPGTRAYVTLIINRYRGGA